MSQLYDIFFAAQLIEGFEEATVRQNIARLFKANDETLEKLFSGKPQLIKRGVDKAAAIKYKTAMQNAGAVARIREQAPKVAPPPLDDDLPSSSDIPSASKQAEEKPALSMADRVAALAGDPEPEPTAEPAAESRTEPTAEPAAAAKPAADTSSAGDDFSLAPAGSDVLREEERENHEELDIDTSAIHLTSEFTEPEPVQVEAPPAPDTSHLSMGEVGEDIPHLETTEETVNPDVSHLSMGEVGEDIPHLEEEVELLEPDTSGIDLAPEGSEVLEEEYRQKEVAEAPNTDHLSLQD
jgi:hypothetical protein